MTDKPLQISEDSIFSGVGEPPVEETSETIEIIIAPEDGELPYEEPLPEPEFGSNLAEFIEDSKLRSLAYELGEKVDSDRRSRADWERTLAQGIDYLGLKIEDRSRPWAGASGIHHPILAEAVVRFQSQAITEMFPASGPVKTAIIGKEDRKVEEQAFRVQEDMNYWLTERMSEYRDETEQLLFNLPLAGSAFRKIYRDPVLGRPAGMFVPAEDFIMPYGYTRLETCPRYTHVMKKDDIEVKKLQYAGMYRAIELPEPIQIQTDIEKKVDSVMGVSPVELNSTGVHTLYEIHTDLELEGFDDVDEMGQPTGIALPYVVTMDKDANEVLSIRRNWMEGDASKAKRMHFVHYKYIPGFGSYGLGLVHLIGGLTKGSTSILRQLIDAGSLANLPAGYKAKDLRIKGDNTPLQPGEFRDADVGVGTLRDSFFTLPFKEPSAVLYQLLGNLIEEGRRFASIADMNIGESNQQAPVGTTLALIERSMKVMSAIQARLHAAQRNEFKILTSLIKDEGPEYDYDPKTGSRSDKTADYDSRVDILPVSDPNASSMGQRILQAQAALQLAAQAPDLYDLPKLHRFMLTAMGVENAQQLVPDDEDVKPTDPVSENIHIMKGKPVKVFAYQDHKAHIAVHAALLQDKQVIQALTQSPTGNPVKAAFDAHIGEHMAYAYRDEVERNVGTPLPLPGDEMTPEVEHNLAMLMAEGAKRATNAAKTQADAQAAQQAQNDPVIQLQRQELQIKSQELQLKLQEIQLKAQESQAKQQLEMAKLQQQGEMEKSRLQLEIARLQQQGQIAQQSNALKSQLGAAKLQTETQRKSAELSTRERMEANRLAAEAKRASDAMEADFAKEAMRGPSNGGGA